MEVKIKQGNEMLDATIEMVDGVMVVSPKVEKFEPKDGDVITCTNCCCTYTLIVKNIRGYLIDYYALLLDDGLFKLNDCSDYINPRYATFEEMQKLFDKLKENGLAWDAEKRKLVKLKWKPKVGDTYFRPDFNRCMFMCYEGKCRYDTMRYIKDCVEKGWVFRTKEECQEFCDRLNDAINSVKS